MWLSWMPARWQNPSAARWSELPGPPEANEAPLRHLRETGHAVEVPA